MPKKLFTLSVLLSALWLYAGDHEKLEIRLPGNVVLTMIKVEKGSFIMGAKDGENEQDEIPHRVTLTRDFYIGETEVTQEQWKAVMKSNPSCFPGDRRPVEKISWNEAVKFCRKLNQLKKAPAGWMFSLPAEAQWEYAAKGGKKSRGCKYSGSSRPKDVAVYIENSGRCPGDVKSRKPNELGLYDMSGNVKEWCIDKCGDVLSPVNYKDGIKDPVGKKGEDRVMRGGDWWSPASALRTASRNSLPPNQSDNATGLRLVLISRK